MAAPTRKAVAWMLIGVSLVVGGMGVASLSRMLRAERTARVANAPLPPRGAATTVAGLAMGAGLSGIIAGAALLLTPSGIRRRG